MFDGFVIENTEPSMPCGPPREPRVKTTSGCDGQQLAGSLLVSWSMTAIWLGLFGLLAISLVRRHGWEYVPLVVLIGVGRFYASGMAMGELADGLTLASFAGLWVVSGRTQ